METRYQIFQRPKNVIYCFQSFSSNWINLQKKTPIKKFPEILEKSWIFFPVKKLGFFLFPYVNNCFQLAMLIKIN